MGHHGSLISLMEMSPLVLVVVRVELMLTAVAGRNIVGTADGAGAGTVDTVGPVVAVQLSGLQQTRSQKPFSLCLRSIRLSVMLTPRTGE